MDSVAGSGHRLKFGHTVDFLPRIYERFGIEGVPAFFLHLLQDFFTQAGLPLLPNAWDIKRYLEDAGLTATTAARCVSLGASNVLAGAMIAATIFKTWDKLDRKKRKLKLLGDAESAAHSGDYSGAVENYKRALELERTPAVLMAGTSRRSGKCHSPFLRVGRR
jgi:hypothetical protein